MDNHFTHQQKKKKRKEKEKQKQTNQKSHALMDNGT